MMSGISVWIQTIHLLPSHPATCPWATAMRVSKNNSYWSKWLKLFNSRKTEVEVHQLKRQQTSAMSDFLQDTAGWWSVCNSSVAWTLIVTCQGIRMGFTSCCLSVLIVQSNFCTANFVYYLFPVYQAWNSLCAKPPTKPKAAQAGI